MKFEAANLVYLLATVGHLFAAVCHGRVHEFLGGEFSQDLAYTLIAYTIYYF